MWISIFNLFRHSLFIQRSFYNAKQIVQVDLKFCKLQALYKNDQILFCKNRKAEFIEIEYGGLRS